MDEKQAVEGVVIVRGAADGFTQEIAAGSHHFRSDEPASVGCIFVIREFTLRIVSTARRRRRSSR